MNGERIKLIGDGGHINGGVDFPNNITLEVRRPYSPELNLVEQVWEDVKYNQAHNQVFTENQSLWGRLEQGMKIYAVSPERVKSITNQEWVYGKKQA
jgi:hypothetical protein